MYTGNLTQTRGAITATESWRKAVAKRYGAAEPKPLVSPATRRALGLDTIPEPVLTPGRCSVCGARRTDEQLDASGRCEECMP